MEKDSGLYLKQIEVGPMANFVYLIGDSKTREVLLVDPAWQMDTLFRLIEQENLKLAGALITHCHYDHVNAVDEMLAQANVPIYINKEEAAFSKAMSGAYDLFGALPEEHLKKVDSGDKVKVGDVEISFIHTPGHTPGSQCFLIKNNLVAGDTLFIKGCGRTDFPGGNPKQMYESLTQKLMKLPDDTILYPGHFYGDEPSSTFADEKKKNPYFLSGTYETFLSLVG